MRARSVADLAVGAVPLVLVPALGAVQGGFHPDTWVWSGALAAWAAALALVLDPNGGRLRRDWPWVVAGAALLLWTLASRIWSLEPAQSLLEARRMLVYAAVVFALVVLARRSSASIVFAGVHAGIAVLLLYTLAHYFVVARTYNAYEGFLLSEPLGYANAVGILSAMGIVLSLGAVTDSVSRPVRVSAAATVPLFALALELSSSRASWLALGAGLAVTAWLHRAPSLLGRAAAVVGPPAALAVAVAHFSGLGTADVPRLGRPLVALVAIGCALVAAIVAARVEPTRGAPPTARTRRAILVAVVAVALLAAAAIASTGVTEPRSLYYHVAWREFLAHPLLGSGAGTFGRYWLLWGQVEQWGGALDAHSLYLETLAELGSIGLLLLAGFFLYPLRRVGAHRALPFVPAAAGATVAFYVHAGLDWDWELPAVVVAGLACAAAVAFAEPAPERRALPGAARAAALAAAVLAGAAAIAGARSTTEPSASPTIEAPQSGASSPTVRS